MMELCDRNLPLFSCCWICSGDLTLPLTVLLPLDLFCSDAISESNPRVIDDSRARKLANDLKRCSYYETCATYGLNVERVFQDGESQTSVLDPALLKQQRASEVNLVRET